MSEIINIDESQRIKRILDGKREEYAWFVKTYSQQVLSFTSRLMPDSEDAKEVAQDAFVKAFRSLGTFNFQSSFCTWVCRIAYHMPRRPQTRSTRKCLATPATRSTKRVSNIRKSQVKYNVKFIEKR